MAEFYDLPPDVRRAVVGYMAPASVRAYRSTSRGTRGDVDYLATRAKEESLPMSSVVFYQFHDEIKRLRTSVADRVASLLYQMYRAAGGSDVVDGDLTVTGRRVQGAWIPPYTVHGWTKALGYGSYRATVFMTVTDYNDWTCVYTESPDGGLTGGEAALGVRRTIWIRRMPGLIEYDAGVEGTGTATLPT